MIWSWLWRRRRGAVGVARVRYEPGRHRPEVVEARLARVRALSEATREVPVYAERSL